VTDRRPVRNLTARPDSANEALRLAVLGAMKSEGDIHARLVTFPTAIGALLVGLLTLPTGAPASSTSTLPDPGDTGTTGSESVFTKIGDFASENATWFIIGLVAFAVILAAFFIFRAGRKEKRAPQAPPAGATPGNAAAAGTPGRAAAAGTVSAGEMKRRRRAAMQRAREEERLRRKGGGTPASKPSPQMDPVEAEKAAARGQAPSAPATAEPPVPPVSPEAPTAVTPPTPAGAAGAVAAGAAAGAMAGRAESAEAEQRLREKVEQIKAGQSEAPVQPTTPQAIPSLGEAAPDLAEAERRLQADREARERTLGQAEARLRDLEARAEAAERRAAFAEQLANLRAEEGEHERRLDEIVSRIDQAEQRARIAEIRAEEAERTASDALRGAVPPGPESAMPPAPQTGAVPPAAAPTPSVPAPDPSHAQAPVPEPQGGAIDINAAGFEELRSAGFSVTQATRVMAYRERFGGYGSVEDLARVPGFTPDVIEALRGQITI
jgi:competence ComEA-like helix-hairpin-helix protein